MIDLVALKYRIMAIEQYLMDKAEAKAEVPWFNTDRVECVDDVWTVKY